jgi:hypothetical protein
MSKKIASPLHIEWTPGSVRALNIATGRAASGESLVDLRPVLNGHQQAIVGIGRSVVFLKTVRLPKAAPDDLRRIIDVQLGQIFALPASQLVFDFIQTNDISNDGCLTLVAAMRSDDLRLLQAQLQQAGLTATRILPMSLAAPPIAGTQDAIVIDSGRGELSLDLVQGGVVRLSRVTPPDADIPMEVRRTLAAAKVDDLPIVTAGDVAVPGSRPATGSPLGRLHEAPPFHFELHEERLREGRQRIEARTRSAVLLFALSVVLLAAVAVERGRAIAAANQNAASWARTRKRAMDRQDAAAADAARIVLIQNNLKTAFEPAQPLSDIAAVIAGSLPANAWLTEESLERGKVADIRGTALTADDVAKFVTALGKSPRFRAINLVFANSAAIGKTQVVQFDVSAVCVGNLPMPAAPKLTARGRRTVAASPEAGSE